MVVVRGGWSLELGARCEGRGAYVDSWAVGKLAKAVGSISCARDIYEGLGEVAVEGDPYLGQETAGQS